MLGEKQKEISVIESSLQQLKHDYEPYKAQEYINLLLSIFPKLSENLRIVQLCKGIGLTIETITQLFKGEAISVTDKLHSPEHDQDFNVQDAKLQLLMERENPYKLRLSLNGQNILDWFRQKYQELKQATNQYVKSISKPEVGRGKGFKR